MRGRRLITPRTSRPPPSTPRIGPADEPGMTRPDDALTEPNAARLTPAQATELAALLDLQARWECLLADSAAGATIDLSGRQKAYEAFRSRRSGYEARYGPAGVPEGTVSTASRLAGWGRAMAAVLRQADPGGACPIHLLEKTQRMAGRLATRLGRTPVTKGSRGDMADAVREMDAVIVWCEAAGRPA
jgi:hypothetical protein